MTASSTCCLGGEKRGLTLQSDTTVPSTLTSTLTVPVFYEQQVEESNLLTSGWCSGAGELEGWMQTKQECLQNIPSGTLWEGKRVLGGKRQGFGGS